MNHINSIVIQAGWSIDKIGKSYFIPSTHYIYLKYIVSKFEEVVLLSPVKSKSFNDEKKILIDFINIKVVELPYSKSFINSIKYFSSYFKAIKSLKDYDLFYCRVPDPFSWLPGLLFNKNCIIHFVGDGFESIWSNQFSTIIQKILFTIAYLPDFTLTAIICYRSKVFTNGTHIYKRLSKIGIKATPLISSTLEDNDFILKKRNFSDTINLLFLGYLSPHKGIKTIIEIIDLLEKNKKKYIFNIIGDGPMKSKIIDFVQSNNLTRKVILYGHLNDRNEINKIIDSSDIFIFPSKSEGSPRVILEVMARSLPVISTPVGSLPECFINGIDILFANFDDSKSFFEKIEWSQKNLLELNTISERAFYKVKSNYKKENFLSQIFG